jgi:hypothetical protein
MDKSKLIDIALTEWTASFNTGSKKTKDARAKFEELFLNWKQAGATFEDLYETYLPKAIKIHLPKPSVVKEVYRRLPNKMGKTEREFHEDWNEKIEATGTELFFEFFPATPIDHDPEPKTHGNMSATEYRAQRRYADQFPTLNTTELVKAWREAQEEYNLDVEEVLENVLGGDDETNS